MIWLGGEYLLFQMPSGESIAFSSDAIAVEIVDETDGELDPDMVKQAANAVYHYFRHELGRHTVTVGEFARAMERALDGFEISILPARPGRPAPRVAEADLVRLAHESGRSFELSFFPRLRDELKSHLVGAPSVVRFTGLRDCCKELAGAKRWSPRCRVLEEEIVGYVRTCFRTAAARADCTLVLG